MTDSPFLNEYFLKGFLEGKQKGQLSEARWGVARVLKTRFKTKVTREVSKRIAEEPDLAVLRNWLNLASVADSWEEFQTQFDRNLRPSSLWQRPESAPTAQSASSNNAPCCLVFSMLKS